VPIGDASAPDGPCLLRTLGSLLRDAHPWHESKIITSSGHFRALDGGAAVAPPRMTTDRQPVDSDG
jgi:hypothetical protein